MSSKQHGLRIVPPPLRKSSVLQVAASAHQTGSRVMLLLLLIVLLLNLLDLRSKLPSKVRRRRPVKLATLGKTELLKEESGSVTSTGTTRKKLMKLDARTVVTMRKMIKVALA